MLTKDCHYSLKSGICNFYVIDVRLTRIFFINEHIFTILNASKRVNSFYLNEFNCTTRQLSTFKSDVFDNISTDQITAVITV